jgi:FixJ family two-component response regulator
MRESRESDTVIAVVDDDPSVGLGLQRLIRSMGWQDLEYNRVLNGASGQS